MQNRKILIMGLPGSGKTTLARMLAPMLNAAHFEADSIRANLWPHLTFSLADRIEHARRMGFLCDQIVAAGGTALADFICPTPETRVAFGEAYVIWLDSVRRSQYPDTDAMFVRPEGCNFVIHGRPTAFWAEQIYNELRPAFDPRKETALFVGRWQPFHAGHKALVAEGFKRARQVAIGVRDTSDSWPFHAVKQRIDAALAEWSGRYVVFALPNVSHVLYGRNVGYNVERITLDVETESISATAVRLLLGEPEASAQGED